MCICIDALSDLALIHSLQREINLNIHCTGFLRQEHISAATRWCSSESDMRAFLILFLSDQNICYFNLAVDRASKSSKCIIDIVLSRN